MKERLSQPLDVSNIKTREQGGRDVSYLTTEHVIRTANEIFGFGGWSVGVPSYLHSEKGELLVTKKDGSKATRYDVAVVVGNVVTVEVDGKTATYGDVGYGNGQSYQSYMDAWELAWKEAASDCEKRCLRHLGDQFGLCLWDKDYKPGKPAAPRPAQSKGAKATPLINKEPWIAHGLTKDEYRQLQVDAGKVPSPKLEELLDGCRAQGYAALSEIVKKKVADEDPAAEALPGTKGTTHGEAVAL